MQRDPLSAVNSQRPTRTMSIPSGKHYVIGIFLTGVGAGATLVMSVVAWDEWGLAMRLLTPMTAMLLWYIGIDVSLRPSRLIQQPKPHDSPQHENQATARHSLVGEHEGSRQEYADPDSQ